MKKRFGYDDSLDAFGVHGIGGTIGAIGCGIFASVGYNSLLFPNSSLDAVSGLSQLFIQIKGVAATGAYSIVLTIGIVFLIQKTIGFRMEEDDEMQGLDITLHGETAYNNER